MSMHRWMVLALAGGLWGSAEAAEPAADAVTISVALPDAPLPLYGRANLPVTVTNRGKVPVALADVALATAGGGATWREELVADVPVVLGKTGAALEGVLEVEDIGPQARTPPPPMWRWKGKEQFRTFLVLAPGEKLERTASFLVLDGMARAEASASWAPADQAWGLKSAKYEPIKREPSPGLSQGVAGVARLEARFEPGPAKARFPPEVLEGRQKPMPHGLPIQAFAEIAWRAAKTPVALSVERAHCSKDEAQKRAGFHADQILYVRALAAWAAESDKDTVMVYADRTEKAPGRLVAAFTPLMEAQKVRIDLSWAPQSDVDGLAAHLKAKGFDVRVREQKGGTWQADVEVDAAGLLKLATALAEKGRRIEATRVEK